MALPHEAWQEEAHRGLMWALAMQGQRNAALAQYIRCREILRVELDTLPEPETVALYERIRESALTQPASSALPFPTPHSASF